MEQVTQIEVFKTTVKTSMEANRVYQILRSKFPNICVNFDLEDCDNILRAESNPNNIQVSGIIDVVRDCGYDIFVLE